MAQTLGMSDTGEKSECYGGLIVAAWRWRSTHDPPLHAGFDWRSAHHVLRFNRACIPGSCAPKPRSSMHSDGGLRFGRLRYRTICTPCTDRALVPLDTHYQFVQIEIGIQILPAIYIAQYLKIRCLYLKNKTKTQPSIQKINLHK
ncbi:hypothetical protein ACDA63_06375 [Uliginosibacterium sp. sgz301328]|uniref:hypothetical protein n=1 Tax=Uliginosibacterium sp. sgz301328 TaxID=3243764 RepID=UPI00359EA640